MMDGKATFTAPIVYIILQLELIMKTFFEWVEFNENQQGPAFYPIAKVDRGGGSYEVYVFYIHPNGQARVTMRKDGPMGHNQVGQTERLFDGSIDDALVFISKNIGKDAHTKGTQLVKAYQWKMGSDRS